MKAVGIICEYDPLHLGHQKQLNMIDSPKVCIMSGNYVQRGKPAIIDKTLRARAAVACGADLVLELPITATLSSAEGFAAEAVRLLSPICDRLCFGAEDTEGLMTVAHALLSAEFPSALRAQLDKGLSFPAARQAALEAMGLDSALLSKPNNILGIEYCKAILTQNSHMVPMPIHRQGSYHAESADPQNPSATAVRKLMYGKHDWKSYIPEQALNDFQDATLHSLEAGERSILCKLRSMTDEEFEALPYGSEGLWRKLMHVSRSCTTLEEIATSVKSKRYTRTRIDRMILCAFLGLSADNLSTHAPYARVLAFNDSGRELLKTAREQGLYPNVGERLDHSYQQIEDRIDALYGLFAHGTPEPPDRRSRVSYLPSTKRG